MTVLDTETAMQQSKEHPQGVRMSRKFCLLICPEHHESEVCQLLLSHRRCQQTIPRSASVADQVEESLTRLVVEWTEVEVGISAVSFGTA